MTEWSFLFTCYDSDFDNNWRVITSGGCAHGTHVTCPELIHVGI